MELKDDTLHKIVLYQKTSDSYFLSKVEAKIPHLKVG